MEDTPQPRPIEHSQKANPEIMGSEPIDDLPGVLGFTETPELSEVRGQLVEALASEVERVGVLAAHYHLVAEGIVEQHQGAEYIKAQIALIIQIGLIKRDAGKIDGYLEDLKDALDYAWNERLEDVVAILEKEIEDTENQS